MRKYRGLVISILLTLGVSQVYCLPKKIVNKLKDSSMVVPFKAKILRHQVYTTEVPNGEGSGLVEKRSEVRLNSAGEFEWDMEGDITEGQTKVVSMMTSPFYRLYAIQGSETTFAVMVGYYDNFITIVIDGYVFNLTVQYFTEYK